MVMCLEYISVIYNKMLYFNNKVLVMFPASFRSARRCEQPLKQH